MSQAGRAEEIADHDVEDAFGATAADGTRVAFFVTEIGDVRVALEASDVDCVVDEVPPEGAVVVDLAKIYGAVPDEAARRVLRARGGEPSRFFVGGAELSLKSVPRSSLIPLPALVEGIAVRAGIAGAFLGRDGFVYVLDVGALLAHEVRSS